MTRITILLAALVGLIATPALGASCDIQDLKCWGSGSKCNIKFLNDTGSKSGSGGGSGYDQSSRAATIKVQAQKDDGSKAGKNTLEILDQQSKTLNLDKKDDFAQIKVWPTSTTEKGRAGFVLKCDDVRNILTAGATCKVFMTKVRQVKDGQKYF
ncbi:MAG: hypothetical protein GC201_14110, partial [Alphaproteobacteria bacterium]|nr:hypothetical protein [Alphaproteobacteria bacterium]